MDNKQARELLETFLQSKEWRVEKSDADAIYRLTLPAGADQLVGYALLHASDFMFYPIAPLRIPSQQFSAVTEYIVRINNLLWTHNFELDYETNQVRCKASFSFRDTPFNLQLVENAIYSSTEAMLHYLPGLVEVAGGAKSAKDAAAERIVAQADSPSEDEEAQSLYNVVTQFYEAEGWEYKQLYDNASRIVYSGHNRDDYFVYITMLPAVKKFFLNVGLPVLTEEDRTKAVLEWMTRMNYNLRLGYFNYDFSQKHLSFVNGIDFYGVKPTPTLLRNVIYPALTTADKYWPYFNEVVTGARSPQEAMPAKMQ